MGTKIKSPKKSRSKSPKKDKQREPQADPLILYRNTDLDNWVMLDFNLLNWKYMNFKMKFRESTYIFTIKKLLRERHGRMDDLKICFNSFIEPNEVKNDMLTLKECNIVSKAKDVASEKSNGPSFGMNDENLQVYQVYYDFIPNGHEDPILLYFKKI